MRGNIVLIGMPGCGKTTVGRLLAALAGMEFLDLDQEIEQEAGMGIPEIFAKQGEPAFRDLETACARKAAALREKVLATGGGIVLRKENMAALEETGVIVFIDRRVEDICSSDLGGRPLIAGDLSRVQALYDQRIGLYRRYGELVIPADRTPELTAKAVLAAVKSYQKGETRHD